MRRKEALEAYGKALKEGLKEYKECMQKGIIPNPVVLDEILPSDVGETCVNVGLVEIPMQRIVGTKSAGRISAFTPNTEFITPVIPTSVIYPVPIGSIHSSDV